MAFSEWWSFDGAMVNLDQNAGAVYELGDSAGNIVFIGGASALKQRLRKHLEENERSCIKKNASQYRYDYRWDYAEEEKRMYDDYVRTFGKPPRCNKPHAPAAR